MTAATVVLVHGPCGTSDVWRRLVPFLDAAELASVAPRLPSSLPESELDDADFLRSVLDDLGGPAVLVGHSGACFPMTEVGKHAAVRHLIYLDGALPDVGETLRDQFEPGEMDASFAACFRRVPSGVAFDTDALAAHLEGRGWSAEEARDFTSSGFVPVRIAAQVLAVTVASWRTVPSTFIGYANSQNGASARSRFAARATHAVEIPGDHFGLWRRPGELAEVIARIAKSVVS